MKKAIEPAQAIQRVKVGMTGLAFVLLLIGLASAIFSAVNRERPVAAIGAAKPDVVANLTNANITDPLASAQKEPLAELGVAPSTSTPNPDTPPPAAKPRQ
ncbi:MAG: hypothetical protein K2X73_09785 [Sphingomonas sp.]|uniref:hypothetical protein n=1 Tax=Sphingomonas sp. TaxID=28214 RepID=UPI0025D275D2|nr:hypothetical protein [Sphingomonas sp.]MBX9882250.1 hypothetical protein [Sphingomonas sp.]